MMPSSSDEESDGDNDESSSSEEEVEPVRQPRRKPVDEPDPAQVAADLARLELIKQRREQQRLERIAAEGFDRFAPPSDNNAR